MKYLKQLCCFLVVMLVMVTCSCVNIGSVARAEETSAPVDPSATVTNPAVPDSNLSSLEAQAAAAGIGVRTVNGVQVFHTKDGQDLEMIKMFNGDDAVKDQGGEFVSLRSALQSELGLPISTEIYQDMPTSSMPTGTLAETSPVCYSQHGTGWSRILIGTTNSIPSTQDPSLLSSGNTMYRKGCFIASTAMEAATYTQSLPNYDYVNHRLTGTASIADPANMNYWLLTNGGLDSNGNMTFDAMANFPSIYGLWQSKYYYTTVAAIYQATQQMIAGTFTTYARPSLPIILMNKTGVTEHYCAWYKSDGSTLDSNNSIVQPTRTEYSDSSLKCTIAASGYSPENDSYLMRVACWKK